MTDAYVAVPMEDSHPPHNPSPFPIRRANTKPLHLPKSKRLDVVFKDVSYTVPTGTFYSKRRKQVLRGVSGRFCSGELTAIMGPSGSGKSTLLNILTGFHREGMVGSITCTDRTKREAGGALDSKDCCYIMQDDNLFPLLSVKEVMMISANLKLQQNMTKKAKLLLVENVIENVGMVQSMDVHCGKLSGGQRKRLSVALELVNNPPVMFLDEPTTGLDSQSTIQIVNLMKSLARGGRNIICTVHQPSASVFEMFDHIYIIASGFCMYQGGSTHMVPFLQSVGLPCPQYHNPADFVLDIISGEFGNHTEVLVNAATSSIWREAPPKIKDEVFNCDTVSIVHQKPPSELYRFWILVNRTLKLMVRDWTVIYLKLILHLLVAITLGVMFQGSGTDGSKAVTNMGYYMGSIVYLAYTSMMPAILKFPSELGVIKKEQFNNWYKLRTYYMAFQVTNLPIQMLFCTQYIVVSYYITSQIMEYQRFLMFLLVNVIAIIISECTGLGLGTAINPVNGIFLGSIVIALQILLAGFIIFLKDMPHLIYYASYLSFMRYNFEGMVLAMYSYGRKNFYCEETYCHFGPPQAVLDQLGISHGEYWTDVSLLCFAAGLSLLYAYYSLRSKMK